MLLNYGDLKMNLKLLIKDLPVINRIYRSVSKNQKPDIRSEFSKLSSDQLLSLMRHESHRIEKSVYNNILESKQNIYREKWNRLSIIYSLLEQRGYSANEPTIAWSRRIYEAFDNLEKDFIEANSSPAQEFNQATSQDFIEFLKTRRSVRVWSENQPQPEILEEVAYRMIDAARWAPTSGNRQPWRFLILKSADEKASLKGIKEEHCTSAPLLIFIGMDTRLYGALGQEERSVYVDAGAAIMQMILLAHQCNLGVCWNHFADDLISSRKVNQEIYAKFASRFHIPGWIAPIAILAIGQPKFIPPVPERIEVKDLMIGSNSLR